MIHILGEWIKNIRRSGLSVAKYFGVNRRFLLSTLHEFEVVATTFKVNYFRLFIDKYNLLPMFEFFCRILIDINARS